MKSLKITFIALFSLAALASCESSDIAPVSDTPNLELIVNPSYNAEGKKLQPEVFIHDEGSDVASPAIQLPNLENNVGIAKEFVSVVE